MAHDENTEDRLMAALQESLGQITVLMHRTEELSQQVASLTAERDRLRNMINDCPDCAAKFMNELNARSEVS